MNPLDIIVILTLHFLADFIAQSDWMALNKSQSVEALVSHTTLYAALMFLGLTMWTPIEYLWVFGLITWGAHTVQDYWTSRLTKQLWEAEKRHWFFVAIGFDQLLHQVQLLGTWWLVTL